MISVISIKSPILTIELEVPKTVLVMKTPTKHDYYEILQGNKEVIEPYLLTEMPPFTNSTFSAFIKAFAAKMQEYREENKDYLAIPEKEDFGQGSNEKIKLPILTSAENLVYLHTGLNFKEQLDLPITEYWLLLADAVKQRMLERPDGVEYLNECYNSMHRISTLSPKLHK